MSVREGRGGGGLMGAKICFTYQQTFEAALRNW